MEPHFPATKVAGFVISLWQICTSRDWHFGLPPELWTSFIVTGLLPASLINTLLAQPVSLGQRCKPLSSRCTPWQLLDASLLIRAESNEALLSSVCRADRLLMRELRYLFQVCWGRDTTKRVGLGTPGLGGQPTHDRFHIVPHYYWVFWGKINSMAMYKMFK